MFSYTHGFLRPVGIPAGFFVKIYFFYKKYIKGIDKYKIGCYLCPIKSH